MHCCQKNATTNTRLSTALLDDNVDITLVKPYCADDTFWEIAKLIEKKSVLSKMKMWDLHETIREGSQYSV